MDRDCNNCVYSTRDGGCIKWKCEGSKTVDDIKTEAKSEILEGTKITISQKCFNDLLNKRYESGYDSAIRHIKDEMKDLIPNRNARIVYDDESDILVLINGNASIDEW